MVTITLRMPGDAVDDLKRVAPRLGFSGYQPLLRADLARLEEGPVEALVSSLRRRGIDESVLQEALEDVGPRLRE